MIPLAALALVLGCGPADERWPGLEPLPRPDLSAHEAQVQEQLGAAFDRWHQGLADRAASAQAQAQAAGELARLLHAYGDFASAEIAYRNARQLAPEDPRWPYLQGVLLQDQGRLQAAIRPLSRSVELAPEDLPSRIRLARSLLAEDRAEEAKVQLQEALALDPRCALAYFLAGQLELEHGDAGAAVLAFAKALEIQPRADTVHGALAAAFEKLGDTERAAAHRELAGEAQLRLADPRYAELDELAISSSAHLRRAHRARLEGDAETALAEHRRAVELAPGSAEARAALGAILAQLGNLDEALEELRNAQRLGGDDPRVLANLAGVYRLRGEPSAAVPVYRRMLELAPADPRARFGLARAQAEAGDLEQAAESYRMILKDQPDEPQASAELEALLSKMEK